MLTESAVEEGSCASTRMGNTLTRNNATHNSRRAMRTIVTSLAIILATKTLHPWRVRLFIWFIFERLAL